MTDANIAERLRRGHESLRADAQRDRTISIEASCRTCGDTIDVPGDEDPSDTLCVACAEEEQGQ